MDNVLWHSSWRDRLCLVTVCLLIGYGGAVIAGWLLHVPVWRWFSTFVAPSIGTGTSLALGGVGLLAWRRGSARGIRVGRWIGAFLALLGAAFLAEYLTGVDLYVDLPALHDWYDDRNPWPGRSSPNTAAGILMAGAGLWLSSGDLANRVRRTIAAALLAKSVLSALAIFGRPDIADLFSLNVGVQFGNSNWYQLSIMHPWLGTLYGLLALNLLWLTELKQPARDVEARSLRSSDISFGVALLLLFTMATSAYGSLQALRVSIAESDENFQRRIVLEQIMTQYQLAETAWTRAISAAQPSVTDLDEFAAARKAVEANVQRLWNTLPQDSARFRQLQRSRAVLQGDFDFMQEMLRRKLQGALHNPADIVVTFREPQQHITELLQQFDRMRDVEIALLVQRRQSSQAGIGAASAMLVFGTIASFGVLIAAFFALLRAQRHRLRLETGLRQANEELELRVTERTEAVLAANRQLETINATLEQRVEERTNALAERTADLESFSYSVSHDLRAPLRAIDGYAAMFEEDNGAQLGDESRSLLRKMRGQIKHMGELVDNLLRLSRFGRQALVESQVDMTLTAKEVWQEILYMLRSRGVAHEPELRLQALPATRGDADLLRQVWMNLIDNAVKYSSRTAQPLVAIEAKQDEREIVYAVRDNGAGFDMRYADKLFGVFERLHDQSVFAGTGVGLAIVSKIVRRHGGRVWAEGTLGKGAVFYFSLPRARTPAAPDDADVTPLPIKQTA